MGKTSNKFIDDITAKIGVVNQHANAFNQLKPQFIKHTDDNIDLITGRVDILNGKYKGDEKKAKLDPQYIALGKQADLAETQGQHIYDSMEEHLKGVNNALADTLMLLTRFETYVNDKDKNTKLPWKKTSVKSSREYIATIRGNVKAYKPPSFQL